MQQHNAEDLDAIMRFLYPGRRKAIVWREVIKHSGLTRAVAHDSFLLLKASKYIESYTKGRTPLDKTVRLTDEGIHFFMYSNHVNELQSKNEGGRTINSQNYFEGDLTNVNVVKDAKEVAIKQNWNENTPKGFWDKHSGLIAGVLAVIAALITLMTVWLF